MQSQNHAYEYHSAIPCECPKEGWTRLEIHQTVETGLVARVMEKEMAALGYVRRDRFAVTLVLREAVANAIRHGHRGDSSRRVLVHYHIGPEVVFIDVADEGHGFDPYLVADPLEEKNERGQRPRWGLLLMRVYMSWVRFNKRGNRVLLGKYRSPSEAEQHVDEAL